MHVLAIDLGSSSVKAAILRGERVVGNVAREDFATQYDGQRAEVDPQDLLIAISRAVRSLERKRIDYVALGVMSPAWIALDRTGKPLTPIVTHQDRRSVAVARDLEQRVGKTRHLKLAGNRPFPGGISSTTCAWFVRNEPSMMRRAHLVGHLNTFLHRRLTGARVIDPSNASFTGFFHTLDPRRGWCDELSSAAGISSRLLPDVRSADEIGGHLTPAGARMFGLKSGTPMLVGITDTSAAMLAAGAGAGKMLNVCGSTDVLALCTDQPRPHEQLLTRALGVGRLWMSVSTLAASGSALVWAKEQLFGELSWKQFQDRLKRISRRKRRGQVQFEPYLAGDRMSIEQRWGEFRGMSLATTREDLLWAVADALAQSSARRVELLSGNAKGRIDRTVAVSGGAGKSLEQILHGQWRGKWRFSRLADASLRGMGKLEPP